MIWWYFVQNSFLDGIMIFSDMLIEITVHLYTTPNAMLRLHTKLVLKVHPLSAPVKLLLTL